MHRTRATLAFILIAVGLVWIGQGTGVIRGSSFMTDDTRWALIGLACVVVGLAAGWLELRGRRAGSGRD
jgi:hypothetical protein